MCNKIDACKICRKTSNYLLLDKKKNKKNLTDQFFDQTSQKIDSIKLKDSANTIFI